MRFANLFRPATASRHTKRPFRTSQLLCALEPRLFLTGLAGPETAGLPSDMITTLSTAIYDQSPSNSEEWGIHVSDLEFDDTSFGAPATLTTTYEKGESYPITIDHLATKPDHAPDYDYRAWVYDGAGYGTWGDGETVDKGTNFFVVDNSGLMQKDYYGSDTDPTVGKTATLEIPGIDLNIDSDNTQGFNIPSNAASEESIENNLDAGKVIVADNGDLNGDGIVDSMESATGVAGDHFVPVTLSLSANIAETQGSANLTFSFDKNVFKLWTKDGTSARSGTDEIGANVTISASAIGLNPGNSVILYVEALKAYNSTDAKPISVKAKVDGSVWSGTLTDAVRVVAVSADTITATMNGQNQISSDRSLTLTDDNTYAIPFSANDSMAFSVNVFHPATDRTKALLKWEVVRNTQDAVTGDDPDLTVDQNDGTKASLQLDGVGSFNIIAYLDANSDGQFEAGEQLRVFHLAIIYVDINPANAHTDTPLNIYSANVNATNNTVKFGTTSDVFHIDLTNVLLIGGGADKLLGLQKILEGYVQNGLSDSVVMTYGTLANNVVTTVGTGRNTLIQGGYPILDADNTNTDPDTFAFTEISQGVNINTPPSGGLAFDISDGDGPGDQFDQTHTFGNSTGQATALQGSYAFSDTMSIVSKDFNKTYSGFFKTSWTFTYNFSWNFLALKWDDLGTKAQVTNTMYISTGGSPGVTVGPLWNNSVGQPDYH